MNRSNQPLKTASVGTYVMQFFICLGILVIVKATGMDSRWVAAILLLSGIFFLIREYRRSVEVMQVLTNTLNECVDQLEKAQDEGFRGVSITDVHNALTKIHDRTKAALLNN